MIIDQEKKFEFNNWVKHPLQSWQWGDFKSLYSFKTVRLARFDSSNNIVEAIQILFRKLPIVPFTIGFIPKSHIPSPELMQEIKDIAKAKKAIFIKFEPEIVIKKWQNFKGKLSEEPIEEKDAKDNIHRLESQGLKKSKTHTFGQYSFILEIDEIIRRKGLQPNEISIEQKQELILENMDKKSRYAIKYSLNHGVKPENSTDQKGIDVFNKLNNETMRRQHFSLHSPAYFTKMLATLNNTEQAIMNIKTANYDQENITALIFFLWQDTLYYPYGASSNQHRNLMSTNLVLGKAIEEAIDRGFKKVDFWGSLGPKYDPKNNWVGFHKFKESFGPDLVQYIGSWDLVLNNFLYFLYSIADIFRRFIIKIKSYIK